MRRAAADFEALRAPLDTRRRVEEARAITALTQRGDAEAEALLTLLHHQERAIQATLTRPLPLPSTKAPREEAEQLERDHKHLAARLTALAAEREAEPARIRRGYEVALTRFEPVGLVYLWPRS